MAEATVLVPPPRPWRLLRPSGKAFKVWHIVFTRGEGPRRYALCRKSLLLDACVDYENCEWTAQERACADCLNNYERYG